LNSSIILDAKFKELETLLFTTNPRDIQVTGAPFIVLLYPPESEIDARRRISILTSKLESRGRMVRVFEPGPVLFQHLDSLGKCKEAFDAERRDHTQMRSIMAAKLYIQELERLDKEADPNTIIFVTRAGGFYRHINIFTLLERLASVVATPTVLFIPASNTTKDDYLFLGIEETQKYRGHYI
jgi:hypothetical protein